MPEPQVDIPTKTLFKASEVCEIAQVQPYVLRSWEREFPGLGVGKTVGGPRVYRRVDVEKVLRIKHLVFGEGLTLAGARRTIEGEAPDGSADEPLVVPLDDETRRRLEGVTRGLRSLLEMLSGDEATGGGAAASTKAAGGEEPVLAAAQEAGGQQAGGEFALEPGVPVEPEPVVKERRKRAWGKAAVGAAKKTKKSPGVGA